MKRQPDQIVLAELWVHYPADVELLMLAQGVIKGKDLTYFKIFLERYADQIVEKWINYFVYHKEVEFEKIAKRLK